MTGCNSQKRMAPQVGLEPTTLRLTGGEDLVYSNDCKLLWSFFFNDFKNHKQAGRMLRFTTIFYQGSPVNSPVQMRGRLGRKNALAGLLQMNFTARST